MGGAGPGRRWRFIRGDKGLRTFENAPETGLVNSKIIETRAEVSSLGSNVISVTRARGGGSVSSRPCRLRLKSTISVTGCLIGLDDYEQGWAFEKLYPIDALPRLASTLQSTSATLLRQKRRMPHKSLHNAFYEAKPNFVQTMIAFLSRSFAT